MIEINFPPLNYSEAYMNLQPIHYVPSLPLECPPHVNLRFYTSVLFGNNCLVCAFLISGL
jgi:hypothetical protein